jgi:hypothetical protein
MVSGQSSRSAALAARCPGRCLLAMSNSRRAASSRRHGCEPAANRPGSRRTSALLGDATVHTAHRGAALSGAAVGAGAGGSRNLVRTALDREWSFLLSTIVTLCTLSYDAPRWPCHRQMNLPGRRDFHRTCLSAMRRKLPCKPSPLQVSGYQTPDHCGISALSQWEPSHFHRSSHHNIDQGFAQSAGEILNLFPRGSAA